MYEIDKKQFGIFVAEHRKEKGYTQKELAEHLFISDKAVSKWETGMSIPDAALWIPLANLLGVTVTELLMCQRVEKATQMTSGQVETLLKKAVALSDDTPELTQRIKRQRIALFCFCMAISFMENLFIYAKGSMSSNLLMFDLMGILFGAYFVLMVKDRLPAYYDENTITSYSDGIFRINMAGLPFNNSNWPHIVTVCRIWTMAILVGYPILYGGLSIFLPALWNTIEVYLTLTILLGGLFVPMYVVGKKYQ